MVANPRSRCLHHYRRQQWPILQFRERSSCDEREGKNVWKDSQLHRQWHWNDQEQTEDPQRRHSRGRPHRQARYNNRNLGTQKNCGVHRAEGEATKNTRHRGDVAPADGFEQHRVDTKCPFELVGISDGVFSI